MKILVTGGAGYLGSVLLPKLLVRGHEVRVLDVGYFGIDHLRNFRPAVEVVRDDICRIRTDADLLDRLLDGCDCIIHLAAISNDPSAELNPSLTNTVNYEATKTLVEAAKQRGIRLLFSSSCSVYGDAENELDENGEVHPLTTYAESKVNSEKHLVELSDETWRPVVLRNGTLFGYSPRMRFDLVVNIFCLYSTLFNEIKVFGDGQQWRPFLHVADCARAFVFFAENENTEHIFYNIADENLRVCDVAEIFQELIPDLEVSFPDLDDPDKRNYRVTTERMLQAGFNTQYDVHSGVEQICEAIITGQIADPESIYYRNAKWLSELSHIGERAPSELLTLMETLVGINSAARK